MTSENLTIDDIEPDTKVTEKIERGWGDDYVTTRTIANITHVTEKGANEYWDAGDVYVRFEGDTATHDLEYILENALEIELPETDDEVEDEAEEEIACDGGDDNTEQFTDEEIVEAIEYHDDPDHPDATTVAEARTLLAEVQDSLEHYWREHLTVIDDDNMSVVFEDSDVLVLADHTGYGWNEELDNLDLPNPVADAVITSVHHKAAERLCDYSWQASDPFVMAKPDDWQLGELHLEHRVGQLATAADVSEAAAMDYWSVEIKGRSQSQWARMTGKSQQTVSENIQKVEDGLGAELS